LFLNRLGGRLLVRSIRTIIADVGQAGGLVHDAGPDAGKSWVHPHTLRHTVATQLLRNGVDIVTVADIMGHARIDTVRLYTRSPAPSRTPSSPTNRPSPCRRDSDTHPDLTWSRT
jgi:integrase/recombinase XerC